MHVWRRALLVLIRDPGGVGELSPRFQPGEVRRDALLTSERRDTLG
jgi:hypothetical protein